MFELPKFASPHAVMQLVGLKPLRADLLKARCKYLAIHENDDSYTWKLLSREPRHRNSLMAKTVRQLASALERPAGDIEHAEWSTLQKWLDDTAVAITKAGVCGSGSLMTTCDWAKPGFIMEPLCPPAVRRMLLGAIPLKVHATIFRKLANGDTTCPICGEGQDSGDHMLNTCPIVTQKLGRTKHPEFPIECPENPDSLAQINDRIKRALLVRSRALLPENRNLPTLPLDANLVGFVVSLPRFPKAGHYVGWGTVKSFNSKKGSHFLTRKVVPDGMGRPFQGAVDLSAISDTDDFGIFRPDNLLHNLRECIQTAQDAD